MQPGGRRSNRPRARGIDGLIAFIVNGFRLTGDIGRQRYLSNFIRINRAIEPDYPVAFVANLNNFPRDPLNRKCPANGKAFAGPDKTSPSRGIDLLQQKQFRVAMSESDPGRNYFGVIQNNQFLSAYQ